MALRFTTVLKKNKKTKEDTRIAREGGGGKGAEKAKKEKRKKVLALAKGCATVHTSTIYFT